MSRVHFIRIKEKEGNRSSPLFESLLDLLCNLCSLAHAAAQIVQLGTANLTVADDLELCDVRSC